MVTYVGDEYYVDVKVLINLCILQDVSEYADFMVWID